MSRILYLLAAIVSLGLTSCNNEINPSEVPSIVENTFESHFSHAMDVEWKAIANNYEVSFEKDKVDYDALLDSSGNLLKYKYEIEENNLPIPLKNSLETTYPKEKWDDPEQVVEGKSKYYQLEIDGFLGDKKIVLDSLGNLLSNRNYWK